MKNYFKITFVSILLFSGIVVLTSSTESVQMFGKAVFPILYNIDNARNGTELNGHLRGDSATGYGIWGRNNHGTEFALTGISAGTFQKDLFTDNENPSVCDTFATINKFIYAKNVYLTNNLLFNRVSFIMDTHISTDAILYIIDSDDTIIVADTLFLSVESDGVSYYEFAVDSTVLPAGTDYYIGIWASTGTGDCTIGGNRYVDYDIFPNSIGLNPDTTWMTSEDSGDPTPPAIGSTIDFITDGELAPITMNLHLYYKE